MQKTSYFINWKERRLVISGLQLTLTGALVLTSPVASAGTPDWLKQAAQAPLPAYPDDTDAVMLLNETFTTVSTTGDIRTTHRKAYKIRGQWCLRSEEHTSELQSRLHLVCRLLLEKK